MDTLSEIHSRVDHGSHYNVRDPHKLRDFLMLPYDQLETLNLEAQAQRLEGVEPELIEEQRRRYLTEESRIKAVTVCFTDLEGRFHMLDYDKKFLLRCADNLTFDGSSIRGFTVQTESDLILRIDWTAFWWLPSDIFGPGKVVVFGQVCDRDQTPYVADYRSRLKSYCEELFAQRGWVPYVAPEIEGFLFKGCEAERNFYHTRSFDFISSGGYFHSLPQDPLRQFIDQAAEAQRAMGFRNEKDHPEVAPSQFEMNFTYTQALLAADQIQLYKLICRQVAQKMGLSASFLPKPVEGVNGNGMHTNISLMKDGENLFYDRKKPDGLSLLGCDAVHRILHRANDLCLILNSSVNAYRRLDPHYEAPNQIKASPVNRAAMIRIPLADARSARIEVRSIAPDANPYLLLYALLKTAIEDAPAKGTSSSNGKRLRTRFLQSNIHDAIRVFRGSTYIAKLLDSQTQGKYAELKQASADRCPKELGKKIKVEEIMFHHEVTNQMLWSMF